MVKLETSDGLIWDVESKIIEMSAEISLTGKLVIDLNNEGPDVNELGLYKILDLLTDRFNIRKRDVSIITKNLLEQHTEYNVNIVDPHFHVFAQQYLKTNLVPAKDISKHFGIFIGRSNWVRLYLSGIVFNEYRDKALQTFHYESSSDFHKVNLGIEKLLHIKGQGSLNDVAPIVLASPITQEQVSYPILTPKNFSITSLYKNIFVDIVCETYFQGNTFFPTEKTWRPIMCKTPFIIQGPRNYLKNLRKLGFETFSEYWDESYDEDGPSYGTETIRTNLKMISSKSLGELENMYNAMLPKLEHNQALLKSLNKDSWEIFK